MDSIQVPPGFRFHPSDKELLNYYLKPKVYGEQLLCDIIAEKQIYGPEANPWDVFDPSLTSWIIRDISKIVYVFTPLTKIAAVHVAQGRSFKKENYVKKAGCGTWHGQFSKPIMEGDNVLGFRRLLCFQINDIDTCLRNNVDFNKIGHWLMHEYVLCGYEDYALCRITVDTSKKPTIKILRPKDASKSCSTSKSKATKKTTTNHAANVVTSGTKDVTRKTTTIRTANVVNSGRKNVTKSCRSSQSKANDKTVTNLAVMDSSQQVVLNENCHQQILASTSSILDNGLTQYADVGSLRVEEKEQVVLNENCRQEILASLTSVYSHDQGDVVVDNGLTQYGDVGGFRVEGTEFQGLAVSSQELAYEETVQYLMNDDEDLGSSGTETLSNFCSGYMDEISLGLELEYLFNDGSWSDMAEFIHIVSNSNNVEPVENMSCSNALGKRKAFEAPYPCSGPSKKLCM